MDIGTEELSHLEIVGTLARMHLKPMKKSRESAEVDHTHRDRGWGRRRLVQFYGRCMDC
jgi:manganese catalase